MDYPQGTIPDEPATKECTRCHETRPIAGFAVLDVIRPNARRRGTCRICIQEASRVYYAEHKSEPKAKGARGSKAQDVGCYEWYATRRARAEQELCRRMVDVGWAADLTDGEWEVECKKYIGQMIPPKKVVV